ncbi:hypothetical protein D3C76_1758210 [compost metagenome]
MGLGDGAEGVAGNQDAVALEVGNAGNVIHSPPPAVLRGGVTVVCQVRGVLAAFCECGLPMFMSEAPTCEMELSHKSSPNDKR